MARCPTALGNSTITKKNYLCDLLLETNENNTLDYYPRNIITSTFEWPRSSQHADRPDAWAEKVFEAAKRCMNPVQNNWPHNARR